jgi:hypothetical protein
MDIQIREARESDVADAGRIIFDAFAYIHDKYSFPRDFPSPDVATGLASAWINHPRIWTIVAEVGGKVVGMGSISATRSARWGRWWSIRLDMARAWVAC